MPAPTGWVTDYSTSDYEYRVHRAKTACVNTHYLAEAVPVVSAELAPNALALYLGCQGVDMPGTVWCRPCIDHPDNARFAKDPGNFYWRFTLRLGEEMRRLARGKFLVGFPDLIEGLDTLAAMRGNQELLADLLGRPDWAHDSLTKITELYFEYYDELYEAYRDEASGSIWGAFGGWAPGRMAKLQCDFSAMISPDMFREFMGPVFAAMTARLDYIIYHWDGVDALQHHDALLAISGIQVLQWTPGAGVEPPDHPRWWPIFHKTLDAGKAIDIACDSVEGMHALRREFGRRLNRFLILVPAQSLQHAHEILAASEG